MQITLAFLALKGDWKIPTADVVTFLARSWPTLPVATDIEETETTLAFRLGETDVIVGIMPAPIPWTDLEEACVKGMLWSDAAKVLKHHSRHATVTVTSQAGAIERARILTQVLAAMTIWPGAVGVFWPNAGLVLDESHFREYAVGILPEISSHLWVGIRVEPNDNGGVKGYTKGLAAFGLMEMETLHYPAKEPYRLRTRLSLLADDQLRHSRVFHDGQTFAESDDVIHVRLGDSSFGLPAPVVRLDFSQTDAGSPLRDQQPRLYGRLLEIAAEIEDRGGGRLVFGYLMLLLGAFAGIALEWYKLVPALAALDLGSIWIYGMVLVAVATLYVLNVQTLQRRTYKKYRQGLQRVAHKAGMSRYEILAAAEGDPGLKAVVYELKRDRWENDDSALIGRAES